MSTGIHFAALGRGYRRRSPAGGSLPRCPGWERASRRWQSRTGDVVPCTLLPAADHLPGELTILVRRRRAGLIGDDGLASTLRLRDDDRLMNPGCEDELSMAAAKKLLGLLGVVRAAFLDVVDEDPERVKERTQVAPNELHVG